MAHLIMVGHPDSGLQDFYQTLVENGLNTAKASRVQNALPTDINAKLLGAAPGAESPPTTDCAQIKPQGIWKEKVLDLIAANAGTDNWGWADPNALTLLDFWKTADATARFLLVYSHPADALTILRNVDASAMREAIAHWQTYNAELLRFYNRNRERCLLLNADRAIASPEELSRVLFGQLGVALKIDMVQTQAPKDALLTTLCAIVAEQFEEAVALHDEMEATASVPSVDSSAPDYPSLLGSYQAKSKLANDADLLLLQLHNTQEELEHYYLLSEKSRKEVISLQKQIKNKNAEIAQRDAELAKPMGALERVQNHLNYRVGKTLLTCSNSIPGWLCLPFALLYQILDFKATRRRLLAAPQLPLQAYADAKQAKQLQSFLSYRVGTAVMTNLGSPARWLRLPGAIRSELKPRPKKPS